MTAGAACCLTAVLEAQTCAQHSGGRAALAQHRTACSPRRVSTHVIVITEVLLIAKLVVPGLQLFIIFRVKVLVCAIAARSWSRH